MLLEGQFQQENAILSFHTIHANEAWWDRSHPQRLQASQRLLTSVRLEICGCAPSTRWILGWSWCSKFLLRWWISCDRSISFVPPSTHIFSVAVHFKAVFGLRRTERIQATVKAKLFSFLCHAHLWHPQSVSSSQHWLRDLHCVQKCHDPSLSTETST